MKRCNCNDIPEDTIHKLAIVLLDTNKTLVVKKVGLDEYISLGGKHEAGETFEQCLQREAMEELGIKISNPSLLGRYKDLTVDTGVPIILDAYLAEATGEFTPQSEIIEYLWVDRNWQEQNVQLASILRKGILPELINRSLL